jgi:hypothetical protein
MTSTLKLASAEKQKPERPKMQHKRSVMKKIAVASPAQSFWQSRQLFEPCSEEMHQ